MKNTNRIPTFSFLGTICFVALITILSACGSSADKKDAPTSDELKENLTEAKEDLKDANQEFIKNYEEFRADMDSKIAANNDRIKELNAEIKSMSKKSKAELESKLAALEARNEAIKEKLANFKNEGADQWESFKREFNHDMDNLGNELKDISKDNVK